MGMAFARLPSNQGLEAVRKMTPLPMSPFIDPEKIEPQPFVLDKRAFWRHMTGTDDDPPPLFIGGASTDFKALLAEIAPTLEAIARK